MDVEQTSYKGKSMQPHLNMCLFGGVRLFADGRAVEQFKTNKSRDLLAFLALYPDRPHERQQLQRLLWADVEGAQVQNRLSVTIYLLRQTLTDFEVDPDAVLDSRRDTLMIRPGAVATDHHEFLLRTDQARQRDHDAYRRAFELYNGPLLGSACPFWADALKIDAEIRYSEAATWLADHAPPPYEPRAILHRGLLIDPGGDRACATLLDWLVRAGADQEAFAYAVQFSCQARQDRHALGPILAASVARALERRPPLLTHQGVTTVCTVQGVEGHVLDQARESVRPYAAGGHESVYLPDPVAAHALARRLVTESPQCMVKVSSFIGQPGDEPLRKLRAKPGSALADLPAAALLRAYDSGLVSPLPSESGLYSLVFA